MVPIEGSLRRSLGHGCDECRRWVFVLFFAALFLFYSQVKGKSRRRGSRKITARITDNDSSYPSLSCTVTYTHVNIPHSQVAITTVHAERENKYPSLIHTELGPHPAFLSYSVHSFTNKTIERSSMYINFSFLLLIAFHFPSSSVYSSPSVDVTLILVAA